MALQDQQKELIGLITEHLNESIKVDKILTYKPSKDGSVTGKFQSANRVFNFIFNGSSATYKPAGNMDNAFYSEVLLEHYDGVAVFGTGIKQCGSTSYSCKGPKGIGCITLDKHCKMALSAIGAERLKKVKALSMDITADFNPDKLEKTGKAISEGRQALAKENREKRSPKKADDDLFGSDDFLTNEEPKKKEPVKETKSVEPAKEKKKKEPVKKQKTQVIKKEVEPKPVEPVKEQKTPVTKEKVEPVKETKKTNDFAESWKGSWDKAPKDLKDFISSFDQPTGIFSDSKAGNAYFSPASKGIHMNGFTPSSGTDGAWRHEYGHYLDNVANSSVSTSDGKLNKLLEKYSNGKLKNQNDLTAALNDNKTLSEAKKIQAEINLEVLGDRDRMFSESKEKLSGRTTDFISSSDKGKKAFLDDEKYLIEKASDIEKGFESLHDSEYKAYKSNTFIKFFEANKPRTKGEVGAEIARLKLIEEVRSEAKLRAEKIVKPRAKNRDQLITKELEKQKQEILLERLKKDGSATSKLLLSTLEGKSIPPSVYAVLTNSRHPVTIASTIDLALGEKHHLAADLIGSITKNKVGEGHADEYYEKGKPSVMQNTEAFANLLALYGSGHPLAESTLKELSPNGFKFMKDTINNKGKS